MMTMMMLMIMAMMMVMVMMMIRAGGAQFNVHRSYKTLVWYITCSRDPKRK